MIVQFYVKYAALVEESSKDPKLAMRDCERRLKKAPHDPAVNLYKVHLLVKQRSYAAGHEHCLELGKISNIAQDSKFLGEFLDLEKRCLSGLDIENDDALVKILGKQKGFAQDAFGALLCRGFWEAAETAAINLQKASPKDKHRQYARCLTSQLYAASCRVDNPVAATMRGRLVKAMLNKAFNTLALSTTQELRFFLQVFLEQEDFEAALQLLDSSELGLFSSLGKGDIEFIRVKLECLKRLQRHEKIREFCIQAIQGSGDHKDVWRFDWVIYEHLTDALAILNRRKDDFDFTAFISTLLPDVDLKSAKSRVLWLAHMRLISQSTNDASSAFDMAKLYNVCASYLEAHHAKQYCFDDLRSTVILLDLPRVQEFLAVAHKFSESQRTNFSQWAVLELNSLKLDFLLGLSRLINPDQRTLESFVAKTISFVQLLRTNHVLEGVIEDAYLLAASGLQKLQEIDAGTNRSWRRRLQAIVLLNHSLLEGNSPHGFRARVALISSYRQMGLTSLAMQHYQVLRIREVQNDTISHLLYHRSSLLHPLAVDTVEQRRLKLEIQTSNPTLGLQKAIDWYDVASQRTNGFLSGSIDGLRYDKVQEFNTLKNRLRTSQQRQLALLERRRIARITERTYDETDHKIDFLNPVWASGLSDMRDFNEGLNFRAPGDSQWEPHHIMGSKAAQYYVAVLTQLDATQSLLHTKDPLVEFKNGLVRSSRAATVLEQLASEKSALLDSEVQAHAILQKLQPLILATVVGDKPDALKEIAVPNEKDIKRSLAEALDFVAALDAPQHGNVAGDWAMPSEIQVASVVSNLDCLKTILKTADLLGACARQKTHSLYRKVDAETVDRLKREAATRANIIQNAAQDGKTQIKRDWKTLFDPMVSEGDEIDEEVKVQLESLIGRRYIMDMIAPQLRDSLLATLDCVSRIKVA